MHPLDQIKRARMPFGRFAGELLLELPVAYLVWFEQHGWPQGRLGEQLATVLTIKQNGLMHLLWEGAIARALGAGTPEEAAQALLRMMQEICRDRWGRTWLPNAEVVLWRAIAAPAQSDVR